MSRSPKKSSRKISWEQLVSTYLSEHQPSHDQKWDSLGASQADMVRAALLKAQIIREEAVEPGLAYLMGLADYHHELSRQKLLKSVSKQFNGRVDDDA